MRLTLLPQNKKPLNQQRSEADDAADEIIPVYVIELLLFTKMVRSNGNIYDFLRPYPARAQNPML